MRRSISTGTLWSGWEIISKLGIALVIGLIVLFSYHFGSKRGRQIQLNWRESIWLWTYFIGLSLISYLGDFGKGLGVIPFGWDFVIIALFCMIILYLSYIFKLPAAQTPRQRPMLMN